MLSLYNWLTPKSLLILILHLFLLFALLLNATIPALAVPYSHLLLQNEVPDPKATPEIAASATTANGIPIPGSPLDIVVYDDGSLSLREAGKNHFYGSRASGVFLWIDNAVYGPYVPAGLTHYDYTVLTHVGPTGTGASSDPWRVSTSFQIGNTGITLQQDVTYINGARDIGFEWHLANSSGVQRNVTLFHAADLYVDGDDYGIGYVEPGKRTVGGITKEQESMVFSRRLRHRMPMKKTSLRQFGSGLVVSPGAVVCLTPFRPTTWIMALVFSGISANFRVMQGQSCAAVLVSRR